MKTPEDILRGMEHCYVQHSCNGCPYIDDGCVPTLWDDGFARLRQLEKKVADAEAAIEERDTVINLMQIQMRGDCGCCAHGKDGKAEPCTSCLASKEYHPRWEYEGLPEIPKGYVLPKKGES